MAKCLKIALNSNGATTPYKYNLMILHVCSIIHSDLISARLTKNWPCQSLAIIFVLVAFGQTNIDQVAIKDLVGVEEDELLFMGAPAAKGRY